LSERAAGPRKELIMSMRKMLILAALLAPLPVVTQAAEEGSAAQAEDRSITEDQGVTEFKLDQVIESIPIHRVPTSTAQRKKQQAAGQRVMLVEGRPGYKYRDFLRASVAAGPQQSVSTPMLRQPQDNPDVYGCVTVSFEIRPDGKTDAFEIEKSEPAGLFDKQALRAVYQTEYQPLAAGEVATARQRHERSIWFLVARPPRSEFSKLNEAVEDSRNRRREELRTECEGPAT
jgi:TonB family protein